jgi:hypothetical protein
MDGERVKSMTDCLLKQKRLIYAKETKASLKECDSLDVKKVLHA